MSDDLTGVYRLGGWGFIASGLLFLVRGFLELSAGSPPSTGDAILAWVESGRLALSFVSEVLFFATMALVPGVVALYYSLADISRTRAVTGCGIIAAVIPITAMLLIVHGRLVYPVYGIRAGSPAIAELTLALYYGGMHAVLLLLSVATFVLSLAMRRSVYGRPIAYLGFATAVLDIAASYPDAIGPALTLVCQVFFAAWFVAVGWKLRDLSRYAVVSARSPEVAA